MFRFIAYLSHTARSTLTFVLNVQRGSFHHRNEKCSNNTCPLAPSPPPPPLYFSSPPHYIDRASLSPPHYNTTPSAESLHVHRHTYTVAKQGRAGRCHIRGGGAVAGGGVYWRLSCDTRGMLLRRGVEQPLARVPSLCCLYPSLAPCVVSLPQELGPEMARA